MGQYMCSCFSKEQHDVKICKGDRNKKKGKASENDKEIMKNYNNQIIHNAIIEKKKNYTSESDLIDNHVDFDSPYPKGSEDLNRLGTSEEEQKINHLKQGDIYKSENRYSEAIEEYQKAIKIKKSQEALKSLTECLVRENRCKEALPVYQELIKINPNNFQSYSNLCEICIKLAEEELCEDYIDTAIVYSNQASFVQEERKIRGNMLDKSDKQIENLYDLRTKIVRQKKVKQIKDFETKILNIFDCKARDLEDEEEISKNKRLRRLFEDKISEDLMKIEDDNLTKSKMKSMPVPEYFECPISFCVMKDPVTGKDGCTYERTEIRNYVENYGGKSPMNRKTIDIKCLYPNLALKEAMEHSKCLEVS